MAGDFYYTVTTYLHSLPRLMRGSKGRTGMEMGKITRGEILKPGAASQAGKAQVTLAPYALYAPLSAYYVRGTQPT